MNDDHFSINFRSLSTLITLLLIVTIVSSTSTLRPIYPCHYKDLNQHIYKCDMCTCLLSPSLYSTSNFCSSSSLSSLICSDNSTKLSNEYILRLRLDEIELETDQQLSNQQYLNQEKKLFNNIQFEFDYFNDQTIINIFNTEQICSTLNQSRLTFYRLQLSTSINSIIQCSLNLYSLRFLDTIIDDNFLFIQTNSDTLIFYNSTLNIPNINFTSTNTLAFYYVKFLSKTFILNSLTSLIHLTITHTTNFDIIGSYPNLIYLDLCHTQLNDIQLNKFFSQIDMPDLITLILSNNYISILKIKFPSTIRYLDLSNNQIKSLDYTSFKYLYSLNTLNLSYNSPLDIQQDTFTRIPYLEILDLTSIQPSSTIDDLFLPLQKLRHLNLSSNYLKNLPRLPVPYDAHTIASYDHHLPVLYVDMSNNYLTDIDFEIFSSASTQDKYIISMDLNNNHLKTLQFPLNLSTGMKRRGPLIELNVNNNPLQCDCILYENLFPLFQNDFSSQQQQSTSFNSPSPLPSGFYPNPYPSSGILPLQTPALPGMIPYSQSTNLLNYIRSRRQLIIASQPSPATLLAQNLVKQARLKLLHLSNLTCEDMIQPRTYRSLLELTSSNSFCTYTKSCPNSCSCCSSSLFNMNNNQCDCYYQCPLECSCKHSFDLTKNYVNCSDRYLNKFPLNISPSTTHLNLNNNQIKIIDNNLTFLSKLQYLSLANNRLDKLNPEQFSMLNKIEDLDLSFNQIQIIHPRTFSTMFHLKHLYLNNNPWIPKFYNGNGEFQSNIRLKSLTYGNGLVCNRSTISSFTLEIPLTPEDCCKHSINIESCQQTMKTNEYHRQSDIDYFPSDKDRNSFDSKRIIQFLFNRKYRIYVLIGLIIFILILICLIILCCLFCLCRKKKLEKHPSPAERKLLSNGNSKNIINHYHKSFQPTLSSTPPQLSRSSSTTAIQKLINSTRQKSLNSNTAYRQQENDVSISYSDNDDDDDDDDYASIPLTVSQTDLTPVIRPQPAVPPLPPPRQTQQQRSNSINRPASHSSTVSTSTTTRSFVPGIKRTNSSTSKQAVQSSLTPARSCLQIKLDALVLYSINDSEFVHGHIGEILENMYGKRFSFHFLHRDRMLGELDWLIENSCVTIIILRKPYHIIHDYMKILSSCSSIKIFLILVNDDTKNSLISSSSSIKAREKIAKLYRTSNIYEWNSNPSSLIHEQLELFLEQNCGSATYVPY